MLFLASKFLTSGHIFEKISPMETPLTELDVFVSVVFKAFPYQVGIAHIGLTPPNPGRRARWSLFPDVKNND